MVLSDNEWIIAHEQGEQIVEPFLPAQRRTHPNNEAVRQISSGLSSAGYDLTLDSSAIWMPRPGVLLDPKWTTEESHRAYTTQMIEREGSSAWWDIPPGGSALGLSKEYITMPRDCLGFCIGKSTYARVGLLINTTPLEPGWCGRLVIEMHNIQKDNPIRVYGNEGIAQLVLFSIAGQVETSYADRAGKYQNQTGITLAKV